MEEVARIFGKKLGKKFYIKGRPFPYVFTKDGLYENGFVGDSPMLMRLLKGEAEIVEKKK